MKVINTSAYEAHMQLPDGSVRLLQPGEHATTEDATPPAVAPAATARPPRSRRTATAVPAASTTPDTAQPAVTA